MSQSSRMLRAMNTRSLLAATALTAMLAAPVAAASPSPGLPVPSPAPSASASPSSVPGLSALDPSASLAWTAIPTLDGPVAREDHTLVVDADGATAWLFGGRDGGRVLGDLWRLDLATDTWTRIDPPDAGPSKRFGHASAWIPGIGMVVFGGQAGTDFFDDLWAFDPATGAWARLPDEGRRPEARYGTCAAVGPDGRLWISHGFTASGRFADTRAWNPTTGRWAVETPRAGDAPVERCLHDCFWSPDGRFLLYGGQTTGVASLGDRWALDPAAGSWSRLTGPDAGPRRLYAAAADGPQAWVFGGLDERDRPRDDLWRWDLVGGGWESVTVASASDVPSPRSGATLIADPARGRLLLLGGTGERGASADLWQLGSATAEP